MDGLPDIQYQSVGQYGNSNELHWSRIVSSGHCKLDPVALFVLEWPFPIPDLGLIDAFLPGVIGVFDNLVSHLLLDMGP